MKQKLSSLYGRDGTKAVLASLISILIGLAVGSVIILIVGLANPALGLSSAWDGIRLVFGGLVSTGRDAAGSLTFGFDEAAAAVKAAGFKSVEVLTINGFETQEL